MRLKSLLCVLFAALFVLWTGCKDTGVNPTDTDNSQDRPPTSTTPDNEQPDPGTTDPGTTDPKVESDGSVSAPVSLTLGQTRTGKIGDTDDANASYYTFVVSAEGYHMVSVDNLSVEANLAVQLGRDSEFSDYSEQASDWEGVGVTLVSEISTAGTYYLKVLNYSSSGSITYKVTVERGGAYSVIYDGNGHTGGQPAVDDNFYLVGNSYNILTSQPEGMKKEGYDFVGWNTAADASGTMYYVLSTHSKTMESEDVVLYAVWTPSYELGDAGPAGGLIFHAKNFYSDGWKYLEAAPQDYAEKVEWGPEGTDIKGTTQIITYGPANTEKIIEALGDNGGVSYAAKVCAELVIGGYSDWFLPSRGELHEMYLNLEQNGLGDFSDGSYWSSSQDNANRAHEQSFLGGSRLTWEKSKLNFVRAARKVMFEL